MQLKVKDDGLGFPKGGAAAEKGSFGLIGMYERVRVLGGHLQLSNSAMGGARIVVRLPVAQRDGAPRHPALDDTATEADSAPAPLTPWEAP